MQKYWFKVSPTSGGGEEHLVTIAPVSQRCPVKLDSSTETSINKLMRALQVCVWVGCGCGCMCVGVGVGACFERSFN